MKIIKYALVEVSAEMYGSNRKDYIRNGGAGDYLCDNGYAISDNEEVISWYDTYNEALNIFNKEYSKSDWWYSNRCLIYKEYEIQKLTVQIDDEDDYNDIVSNNYDYDTFFKNYGRDYTCELEDTEIRSLPYIEAIITCKEYSSNNTPAINIYKETKTLNSYDEAIEWAQKMENKLDCLYWDYNNELEEQGESTKEYNIDYDINL